MVDKADMRGPADRRPPARPVPPASFWVIRLIVLAALTSSGCLLGVVLAATAAAEPALDPDVSDTLGALDDQVAAAGDQAKAGAGQIAEATGEVTATADQVTAAPTDKAKQVVEDTASAAEDRVDSIVTPVVSAITDQGPGAGHDQNESDAGHTDARGAAPAVEPRVVRSGVPATDGATTRVTASRAPTVVPALPAKAGPFAGTAFEDAARAPVSPGSFSAAVFGLNASVPSPVSGEFPHAAGALPSLPGGVVPASGSRSLQFLPDVPLTSPD